jgi:hypothetical protein
MNQSADQKNSTAIFYMHRVFYTNLGSKAEAIFYVDDEADARRLIKILVPTACNVTVTRGSSTLATRTGA